MPRLKWQPIITRAGHLVRAHETSVTLRQLFYLLLSEGEIPNTKSAYSTLSRLTAKYRREGIFPALIDNTREIHQHMSFTDPAQATAWLAQTYRLDRTEGQTHNLWLGAEKSTMLVQLQDWFADLGVPIVPVRGYSSQTLTDDVAEAIEDDGRPAVLIYAGDFDASGEDIHADFLHRVRCFAEDIRIGINLTDIDEYGLVVQPGKPDDSRALGFARRHNLHERYGDRFTYPGHRELDGLIQVEVEALPPADLRAMYAEAIERYWDTSTFEDVRAQEEEDRRTLGA